MFNYSGSVQCSGSGALGHWLHRGLGLGPGNCQVRYFIKFECNHGQGLFLEHLARWRPQASREAPSLHLKISSAHWSEEALMLLMFSRTMESSSFVRYKMIHDTLHLLIKWLFQQHQLKDLSTAIAQSDVARRKKISTEKKDTNDKKNKS